MAFRYSAPQIKTNSPKNIAPLTRFIVPTMRKGDSSKNGGSVLHRQTQRGKLVVPLATATSRDSTKTSKPKYQRNMAAEVPLKKTRRPLVPPLSDPAAGKTTPTPRRTHDAPRQAGRTARTLPASAQPTAWKTAHPLAQRQIPRKRRRQSEHPSHCRTHRLLQRRPAQDGREAVVVLQTAEIKASAGQGGQVPVAAPEHQMSGTGQQAEKMCDRHRALYFW